MSPTLSLAAQFPTKANGGISADGKVWTIHIRPNVKWSDGQPLTAADVAFTYNYIVKNHMANMALTTTGIASAKEIDPTTVQIICSQPKANMESIFLPILPKHVWEHVLAAGRRPRPTPTTADRRQRSLLHGSLQEGLLRRDGAQPLLLGQEADRRPDLLRDVPGPRHHGAGPEVGRDRRRLGHPRGPVQAAPGRTSRHPHASPTTSSTGTTSTCNCSSSSASTGNPVLRDARFREALNYAIDRSKLCAGRLRRPRGAGHDDHAARHLVRPRLPLAAAGRPGLHVRPRQGQPAPRRGRLQARRRAACASTRASRSPCAWPRRPTSPRARSRPS